MKTIALSLVAALLVSTSAIAQNSAPQPVPVERSIAAPVDAPYPGTMAVTVDAQDTQRGIFNVIQVIPVKPGSQRLTLLYPQWLPGKHGPRGALAELAGLTFYQNRVPLKWVRDPVDVYAFHIDLVSDAPVDAMFQFTSPTRESEGRVVVTPAMMNIQWEQVSFYPAGHFTRQIRVKPTVLLPRDWKGVAAMDGQRQSQELTINSIMWDETSYENFIDSPLFAGAHFAQWDLGQNVTLNVWADEPSALAAKPEHIAAHRAMVDEAVILFGSKHFDRYEFLLALTDEMGGIGLEHHRSSENSREPDYFTEWESNGSERGLLPHELVHSWNGKFRRPARLWTPDYHQPMQDNLLWVYEGQTSYWDLVLAARSGLQSRDMVLGEWARYAGTYSEQPGRSWRSVEDTTHDPIFAARKPKPFASQTRGEDYYNEGSLIWLEADMLIRRKSGGRKSLDDFARGFFGIRNGDWGQVTYEFEDVVAALNAVIPHDWAGFLDQRLRQPGQPAPLAGIEAAGYRLVWKVEPNVFDKERMSETKTLDLTHSLGLVLDRNGVVTAVQWEGAGFDAGITNGTKIVAVNGVKYDADGLKAAITAATAQGNPQIELILEKGDRYRTVSIAYTGGLRWPHLEPTGAGTPLMDRLLAPRRSSR